ncbi:hypothetical protein [Terasakiella sp. SH-1]|uniref:hypothetical protein n=1 Tax=Terasakiella sp. SH-1 TaxID=2560057 RepID=UPI001073F0DB|nr:hypothetical protein [Terasakiella sp. SH-1]
MITKQLYIIPVLITGKLPPRYMPDEFAQPCLSINDYHVEFLDISVQQRYDGPYRINAAGYVVAASTEPQGAIYSIIDTSWCKLTDTGITVILDDVIVSIGTADLLEIDLTQGVPKTIPVDTLKLSY